MKRILLLPASGMLLLVSPAQQAPPSLHITTPTTWDADWAGEPHRVYFAQWSADLENWVYLPTMKFGEEMHGIGASATGDKVFLRLHHYDDTALADLEAAKAADFDEDGISNWDEVTGSATNPTDPDTDGDTLPDGWEVAHGLDPSDDGSTDPQNGANGSFQGGTSTNAQAYAQGVQANSSATLVDLDGDGADNAQDADPACPVINWSPGSAPAFAVMELEGAALADADKLYCEDLSENGTVLLTRDTPGGSIEEIVVNRNRVAAESGVFHVSADSPTSQLIGDMVLGYDAVNRQSLWNPVDGTFTEWDWEGNDRLNYQSDICDHRHGMTVWDGITPDDDEYGLRLSPDGSLMPGGAGMGGIAMIERNRNIISAGKYWRWDEAAGTHAQPITLPENAHTSATLRRPGPQPGQTLEWNLATTNKGLAVAGNGGAFALSSGSAGTAALAAVAEQGWFLRHAAGETEIWANGAWSPLRDLLGDPAITSAEVLRMLDTGLAVARLQRGTDPHFIALLVPVEVTWEEFAGYGNVSDHIDPWITPETANGKRIFPGAKNPDEPAILDKLELVVKTLPSQAGKTVYVKAFDVDDTTSEAFDVDAVLDSHDKKGDDNLEDYKQTPKKGQFWTGSAWGNNESSAVIDSNGEARFTFGVGMQPGNNYRVVSSIGDAAPLAAIQVTAPTSAGYLGSAPGTTVGLPASPLLTVWRRLWVENDSMEAIPVDQYGYERNDLSWDLDPPAISNTVVGATATVFSIPQITDQGSFDLLENGRIIVQSVSYPVIGTGHYGASPYLVTVSGQITDIPEGSGFRLYDDDSHGLAAPSLPRNDLVNEQMKRYFRPAFVEVFDAASFNSNKEVPLRLNENAAPYL